MNKIHNAFQNKKVFIGFLTAGDPTFEDSFNNIMAMVKGGADLIEIGIPFSDPIAEGDVVQGANIRALKNGMTTDRAFELVERVRKNTDIPICFMTYLNPVFKYGYDSFFKKCQETGVDCLICPDMPYEEKHEASDIAAKYDVSVVSMVVPAPEERIRMIAADAEGFLYIVAAAGENKFPDEDFMEMVRRYSEIPAAISYEPDSPDEIKRIVNNSDGIIIGSAIVKLAEKYGSNAPEHICEYVRSVKEHM